MVQITRHLLPGTWLAHWASVDRHVPALEWDGGAWDRGALLERVDSAARRLSASGVRQGDRVGICLPNRPEYVVAFLAVARIGAILVPMNPRLSAREILVAAEDSRPAIVIVDGDTQEKLPEGLGSIDASDLSSAGNAAPPVHEVVVDAGDPIAILYTSGTTGAPKGAVLSHGAFAATARAAESAFALTPQDRHLIVSPLSFTGGLLTSLQPALATGGCVHLERDFDTHRLLGVLRSFRPTIFMAVPAMLSLLARSPEFGADALSSLRYLGSGSAPVGGELFEEFMDLGLSIGHAYGLTEGGGLATVLAPHDAAAHLGSAGTACEGIEMRIVNDAGVALRAGDVGEVQQRGPNVMSGYWGSTHDSEIPISTSGWLSTGDLGRMDADGFLYVVGRKKDLILSGGINVYPAEVESALGRHPAIADVAVVGTPHEIFGETVTAYLVAAGDAEVSDDQLKSFASGHLADYKVPKRFVWLDELPRTLSGKIMKNRLCT